MLERTLENSIFRSRWLLAPLYLGLVSALILLMAKFGQEIWHLFSHLWEVSERDVVLGVLSLVDLTLVANLIIIVVFSGYENFVSKIDTANSPDRPDWMGKVDYSGLKLKLIGSIVAISAIDLLKSFMNIKSIDHEEIMWMVIVHLTFVISGVLFAWMDKLASEVSHH